MSSLTDLFEQAIICFPYATLDSPSHTKGSLEEIQGTVTYAEAHTFHAGTLLGDELIGKGWISLQAENQQARVSGLFHIARNGDWEQARILPDQTALQGVFDLKTATWDFWIDLY